MSALANSSNLAIANYGVPQWYSELHDAALDGVPNPLGITWAFLSDNLHVLSPFPYVHPAAGYLHLQVGGSVLCALVLTMLLRPPSRMAWALFVVTATSLLFVTSFFHLFPLWRYMPRPAIVIQFPYRLLLFSTVFGNLLLGVVLNYALRKRLFTLLAGALVVSAVSASMYVMIPSRLSLPSSDAEKAEFTQMDWSELKGDVVSDNAHVTEVARGDLRAAWNSARVSVHLNSPGYVQLPVFFSGRLSVWDNGRRIDTLKRRGAALVLPLDAGFHHIEIIRTEPPPLAILSFVVGIASITLMMILQRRRQVTM
jgi:hypothetical protein